MGFLLAVLSFVVAEEVVELEPVYANGACSDFTSSGQDACESHWYCAYNSTPACINDPCLNIQENNVGCENTVEKQGVHCTFIAGATAPNTLSLHDCKNPSGSGGYCTSVYKLTTTVRLDYCAYASTRDGGDCPQSICKKDSAQDNRCVSNAGVQKCTLLSTQDCKLVPKCMVSGNTCVQDPCFAGTDSEGKSNENQVCPSWIPVNPLPGADPLGTLVAGDCSKEYKPYKNGGGLTQYCIHKDHKDDPNLCYYLGFYGNDSTNPNDFFVPDGAGGCGYDGTYPTYYEFNSCVLNPECTAPIAGCDGVQECTTKYNPTGAFAGAYCGDKTHGAATNLRIPSLIALLVIAIFAFFN